MSNNKLLVKDKVLITTVFLYLAYTLFPVLRDLLPLPTGLLNVLVPVMIVLLEPKSVQNRPFIWFVIYMLVLLIYVGAGKDLPTMGIAEYDSHRLIIIEGGFIAPALTIWSVLKSRNKYQLYKAVTVISLFFIIIELFYLTPLVLTNSNLLRSTVEGYYNYSFIGIPRYAYVHAIVLITPVLLFAVFHCHYLGKIGILLVLLSFTIIVFKSDVTTIIIIFVVDVILSFFFYYTKNNVTLIIITFFILSTILVLYATGAIDWVFERISDLANGTSFSNKMKSVGSHFSGDEYNGGTYNERLGLHRESWKAFTNNIITGSTPVGNHSSILDRLGGLGLIGFVPYICIFTTFIKRERKNLSSLMVRRFFYLVTGSTFLLLYQKGLFGEEGWLFFLVICPSYFNMYMMRNSNQI